MPVAAAGLPDIAVGDPDPLVGGGVRQHPLQQLAVAGLDHRSLVEGDAGSADSGREIVANALQLAEVEDAGLVGRGGHSAVELDPRKSLGEEPGQLLLEPADLAAQLDPRQPLVSTDAERSESVSFEQIRHIAASESRSRPDAISSETWLRR